MNARVATLSVLLGALLLPAAAGGQGFSDRIRLNQLGFYPGAPKTAVVLGADGPFHVTTPDLRDTVFTGTLSAPRGTGPDSLAPRLADFSALDRAGSYMVVVPRVGYSHPFPVRPAVHAELARAAARALYLQRASTPIPAEYGGHWSRPAGHPDDRVLVHPSAATARRPAGTVLSSPGGWYDAGDYNKYVVNSAISTGTLLSLYEDFPGYLATLDLGIPESGNALPDLLDEALWNLRWMMTMQDPDDGGVYHKLTEAQFSGMQMPDQVLAPRYVVQKSTAAALGFAAVMAQASRVFRGFEHATPGLADSALVAAQRAWQWARQHPDSVYDQRRLNQQFDPDIATGEYGDRNLWDEHIWAAAELYATTGQNSYVAQVPLTGDTTTLIPSWAESRGLGYQALLRARAADSLPLGQAQLVARLLGEAADSLAGAARRHPFATPMGGSRDFIWGSNAVAANQGISLVQAYRRTGDRTYLRDALANLDYLLGRNGTGFSYVTGFGRYTPLHPHHRPSVADGARLPVPGWLVGGPNPSMQDRSACTYPDTAPDRAYVDHDCSYASNEVAINWNTPLIYLAVALEALQYEIGREQRR